MPRKITKVELLSRFKKTHGSYYDYRNVRYEKMWSKVEIICPIHGKFLQAPVNHINGMGCKECGKNHGGTTSILSKNDFINRSKKIFGNQFDYSKVIYKNSRDKVTLRCLHHKYNFDIKVNTHLTKPAGCPLCGKESGKTKLRNLFKRFKNFEEFKKSANKIHNNRYKYKKFEYLNGKQLIKVICPQHGIFKQQASNHLLGKSCDKCARIVRADKLRMTQADFISAARLVHNSEFDYSKVKYISFHSKIKIVCKKHGQFYQSPASHLSGNKCIKCGFDKTQIENRLPQSEYIKRAKSVHGTRYIYSNLVYKSSAQSVQIICKKHGPFYQNARAHLTGSGCPNCHRSKGEDIIALFLKKHKIKFISQWRKHNCRDKNVLAFDFYLPKYKTIIEFDGIQHFVPVSFGGQKTEDEILVNFEQIQIRDSIKRNWAKQNKFSFLRIKYNQNIIKILEKNFL